MAEAVVTQLTDGVKAPVKVIMAKPVFALTVALVVVSFVVLIEMFRPGAVTGPIRRFFGMVGIKGKAA